MTRTNKAQASRMGVSTQQATPEAIDNQHIFEDGGEEPNAYDKFYNSKVGEALQWVPYVGTALDIGNAINHPSWESAGWAAASLASDLFGGRIATKAAKTAAKKVIAEGVKNGGYVLRRTPRGTRLKIPTKAAAKNEYVTTKIAHTGLMNSDNFAQYLANAWGSYQRPIHLPEVTVTANYPHELRVWNTVNLARYGFNEPEFLRRLDYNDRRYIKTPYGGESTHLMTNDGNYAYPMILDINGTLHNYDEKYGDYWNRDPKENGDYIKFLTPGDARYFAEHYKKYWPIFFQGAFKDGKDMLHAYGDGKEDIYDKSAKVGNKTYPARTMIINGKETPVFLADDNRMYAVGDDKTPFEIWSQYSLPEVTVTPSKNKDKITGNYYNNSANRYYDSSYDPNGFMDFMNAATLGIGNRLSVSQNARLVEDIYDATTGNKSWEDVVNSAILGNNGIFVNPYANMALDMVAPMGLGAYKYVLPRYNIQNIRNLAYANIKPYDYEWGKIIDFGKDLIKGKVIDSNDLERLKKWRLNPKSSYDRARVDAWRIRTGNPQLYDTFTPIGDNYYTAEKDINRIIRNGGPLSLDYTSQRMINGKLDTKVGVDAVNRAGGHVGNIGIYPLDIKPGTTNASGTGIFRMTDLWDLQPFKGHYDLFEKMLENGYIKAIQNPIRKLTTPLYRQLIRKGIDSNLLEMIRNNTPFYKEYGFNGRIIGDGRTKLSKAMNKFWDNHIGNLEAGSVLKTKPFTIVNEMPVNFDFVNEADQKYLRKLGYPLRTTFGTINPPYIDVAFPFDFKNIDEVSNSPGIVKYLNFRGKNSVKNPFNENIDFDFDDIKDSKDMLPGFKGGFDSFANGVGRAIYNEMIANGWYTPARYDNIMSLLSSESGHGTSMLATKYHNYGGRKNAKGGYMHFKDDSAFAKDHLAYLQRMHRAAWNAKDTMDYVKALKASNYMGDNIYHYYNLLKGQLSARKAWNAAMKTWVLPKLVIKTEITEPVDATRVAKPVMEIPVLIEQPRQLQPTTYIDTTLLFDQPEEILQPVVEDNYEASLLPSIQDAMLYFLPSLTPFANNDFMSLLVQVGLPGAKYGKDSGIHIKPSHRGRFTRYLKSHPGMTAEKAKHSKSAAVRKMATFALNARKWRH